MKKILFLFLLLCLVLAACSGSQPVAMEGTERDTFLAKAEPLADDVLNGMRDHDYAKFSKDMDAAMLKAINQAEFDKMLAALDPKIGSYQSRSVASVSKIGKFDQVVYNAKYSNDDPVTVRIVFTTSEPLQVTGLWFDSAKLRQK
jgi:hypothetical protein